MPAKKTPITRSLSVKTILLNDKGKFLLLRRSAASKNNAGRWELPGGKVDPKEDFETALCREVREETGLEIELVHPLETAESNFDDRQVIYLVMLSKNAPNKTLPPGTKKWPKWVLANKASGSRNNSDGKFEHDAFKWVSPDKGVDEYEIVPQFRGAVRHYLQHLESLKPARPKPPDRVEVKPEDLKQHLTDFGIISVPLQKGSDFLVKYLKGLVHDRFPMAEISGRSKGISSLAMKIIKKAKYDDPMRQLTDLIGCRVIVHLSSEVAEIGKIIREHFDIDEENTYDTLSKMGVDQFGYRSVHYIVKLGGRPIGMPPVPDGLRAEIQVRTIVQHAWADIGHDRLYKGTCEVSDYWKRESNRVAALLEAADEEFQRLVDGIAFYEAHQPRCPDLKLAQIQVEQLRVVRALLPDDIGLALRHARLAHGMEDWREVAGVMADEKHAARHPVLLALRGHAKYKQAKNDGERKAAEEMMEAAARALPDKAEPHLLLAECIESDMRKSPPEWDQDVEKALTQYRLAFEAEPDNPTALSGYIRLMTLCATDMDLILMARPAILKAIERHKQLVAAGVNHPRNYYQIAEFLMLLGPGEYWESLAMLALAVNKDRNEELAREKKEGEEEAQRHEKRESAKKREAREKEKRQRREEWIKELVRALESVDFLAGRLGFRPDMEYAHCRNCRPDTGNAHRLVCRPDMEHARRFLYAALLTRRPDQPELSRKYEHLNGVSFDRKGPFVIVAGGCDPMYEKEMARYAPILEDAFKDYEGVVISGGTTQGISGLVGKIAEMGKGRIYAIGHLPKDLPDDGTADSRYDELRRAEKDCCGCDLSQKGDKAHFTALEPIRYWLDLLATGVDPKDVRLLGINGGRIAHLEYRFALALGAHVALLHGSGREAERFLKEWPRQENDKLIVIPPDAKSIRAFLHLGVGSSRVLAPEIIEEAAQLSHEDFLDQQRYTDPNPVMQPWAKLREDIKDSNRSQFSYIENNLKTRGYGIRAASGKPASLEFTTADIEAMAEVEHGRWVVERIQSGWTYGKVKDAEKKTSPYLVGWDALTDPVRKWDRNNVRLWPELLARFGLEIYRLPKDKAAPKKARPKKK